MKKLLIAIMIMLTLAPVYTQAEETTVIYFAGAGDRGNDVYRNQSLLEEVFFNAEIIIVPKSTEPYDTELVLEYLKGFNLQAKKVILIGFSRGTEGISNLVLSRELYFTPAEIWMFGNDSGVTFRKNEMFLRELEDSNIELHYVLGYSEPKARFSRISNTAKRAIEILGKKRVTFTVLKNVGHNFKQLLTKTFMED